jgi:regulator of replication initiation timing
MYNNQLTNEMYFQIQELRKEINDLKKENKILKLKLTKPVTQ